MDDLQRREFHDALLRTISAQAVVLTLGGVLFVGTVIWVATFPVTVTI